MLVLFEHLLIPLLEMSIIAAFVAVVVILLRLLLKKRAPKQVICLLWLLVFARLLIPVMVESPISLVPPVLDEVVPGQVEQAEDRALPVETPDPGYTEDAPVNSPVIPETSAPTPGNVVTTPSDPVVSRPVTGTTQDPVVTPPVTENPPVVENPPVLEAPSEPETPAETPVVEESATPVWMYIVPAVWLAGVAVMLAVGIGSYVKLRRRVYDAIRTEDGVWEHPSLASPFILGLIRPKIYLPMGIEGQPRQFILHHERAHLRRLDHVVKPICWLALAIHWFNPLAWVAFLLMSRDIETACDESVIRKLGSEVKADYSATLLALATDKRFPAPSPLSFGEGDAKVRIKNVLNFKKPALWVTIAAVVVAVIAAVCLLTDPVAPDKEWTVSQWAAELSAEDLERAHLIQWHSEEQGSGFDLTAPQYQQLSEIISSLPESAFGVPESVQTSLTLTDWMKEGDFRPNLTQLNPPGTVYVRLELKDGRHAVLMYYREQLQLSVLQEASGKLESPWTRSYRCTVESEALMDCILQWVDPELLGPDLSGYTTREEYPGLYFLEAPSSTVGTKITAYKLADGELVLVGGYDEHMANNFYGLIGPDGEEEYLFLGPDEVYAMFEELLAAACLEMDPDWTPPGEEIDLTDLTLLASLPEYGLNIYRNEKVLLEYILEYGGHRQKLPDGLIVSTWIMPDFYPADRNGDGVEEIVIRFNQGHGTGFMEDCLLACQLTDDGLKVDVHDWSDLAEHFNENVRFRITDGDTDTIQISYGGFTARDEVNGYLEDVDWAMYDLTVSITGDQVHYSSNGDDTFTLSFDPGLSGYVPMAEYFRITAECTLRYTGSEFEVVEELHLVCDDLTVGELPDESIPLSALGELFLSALEEETTFFLPEVARDPTTTLSGLLEIIGGDMSITEIAAVDLDGDDIEEVLLRLETPSSGYGTLVLHYNSDEGKVYGYILWLRSFFEVKADGTFYYSDSSASGGIARLSFTNGGHLMERITYTEEGNPDRTIYYFVDKQPATEAAYNRARDAWQAQPAVVWTEYTAENAEALIKEHFEVTENAPPSSLAFLASLPSEIVTSDTLPTDPEEYYLVAELPESHVYLYARNYGQDSMLLWNGNFWWPLEGRVAHTGHMNLPAMYLLKETASTTDVAVVSEVNTGTGVGMDELVVYAMGENVVSSSHYIGMEDYVYDWRPIAKEFSENNTLVYDADTNSLTLFWNGTAYCTGALAEDLGQSLALEDGFTGTLTASGDIFRFTPNGDGSFTATMQTAIAGRPMSIGITGFELTWTVAFTGSGFEASTRAITVTNREQTFLEAAFPEEGIYLFALGNGGEYYYLFEGGQLHKVPGAGILTDLDVNCHLVDLDGDGQMELAMVGNHYSGSSSASILSVFDKGADGWQHYRLPSYSSSNTTDYVSPFGGPDLMNDAASFTIGSDPTQVTMHLGGFDFRFTVSDEVAARDKAYYIREYSRSIVWEDGSYYLHLPGEVCRRYTGMVGAYSDTCDVSFEFVFRLEYNADGTFEQVPVGINPQYPNFTLLDTITGRNSALYFDTEHSPFLVEGFRSGRLPYDEEEILFRCEKGTLMETQLSDGTPAYLVELREDSGEVQAALYVVWSEAENAWVYPEEKRPYLSVNSSSLWQWLSAGSGDFYAIRSSDLTAVMWGSPDYGYYFDVPMDAPVEFISGAVTLSSGPTGTTMAIDTAGTLWGLGTAVDPVTLEPRQLLDSVAMVSCGQYDSYVVRCDGSLWSYGHNETALPTLKTMEVNGVTWYKLMDNVIAVQAGGYGSGYAILSDHTLWAWNGPQSQFRKIADNVAFCFDGRIIDLNGNLLDGNGNVLLTGVKYANYHYAIKTDGTLWALTSPDPDTLWGAGTPLDEPALITDNVSYIASGEFESVLMKRDGSLWKLAIGGTLTDISFVW